MKKQYSTLLGVLSFSLLLGIGMKSMAQSFHNPLPIPKLYVTDNFHLTINALQHNYNPNGPTNHELNTNITSFAFNQLGDTSISCLGPSLLWRYKHHLNIKVKNNLKSAATVHWHGAHVPVYCDGGPHQRIAPDSTWNIGFRALDRSATMWYHPHIMDHTFEQVQMGMSGMLYIADPPDGDDDSILVALHHLLPTHYGANDFPIIVQTKRFSFDSTLGKMVIDTLFGATSTPGYKDNYYYVINGMTYPYMEVPNGMVRLRVLNGDSKFAFQLGIGDKNLNPDTFQLLATDAGYTDSTYAKESLMIAPGGRTEWLLDLRTKSVGDTFYLINYANKLPGGVIGNPATTKNFAVDSAIMKFVVVADTNPPSQIQGFPIALAPLDPPAYDSTTFHRKKTYYKEGDSLGNIFTIDHEIMDMMIVNDTVMLDSTELWTIHNTTKIAHPWHIHDIHFYVTRIEDSLGFVIPRDSLPEYYSGPLDDAMVLPGWKLTYVTKFDDFGTMIAPDSTYMFHCHILPHEDKGMMGQFVVWNGKVKDTTSQVQQVIEEDGLRIYPNPASNYVVVEGQFKNGAQITFRDIQGKVLSEVSIPEQSSAYVMDLPETSAGILIMECQYDDKHIVKRLMVE